MCCLSAEISDYNIQSNNVTLSDTTTRQCVSVDVVDDSVLEDTESLTVSLSLTREQSSVSLSPPAATIFITDNDGESLNHFHFFINDFSSLICSCGDRIQPIGVYSQ